MTEQTSFDFRQGQNTLSSQAPRTAKAPTHKGLLAGGKNCRDVNQTTHPHLVPSLRMSGAIPPLTTCPYGVQKNNLNVFPYKTEKHT